MSGLSWERRFGFFGGKVCAAEEVFAAARALYLEGVAIACKRPEFAQHVLDVPATVVDASLNQVMDFVDAGAFGTALLPGDALVFIHGETVSYDSVSDLALIRLMSGLSLGLAHPDLSVDVLSVAHERFLHSAELVAADVSEELSTVDGWIKVVLDQVDELRHQQD